MLLSEHFHDLMHDIIALNSIHKVDAMDLIFLGQNVELGSVLKSEDGADFNERNCDDSRFRSPEVEGLHVVHRHFV